MWPLRICYQERLCKSCTQNHRERERETEIEERVCVCVCVCVYYFDLLLEEMSLEHCSAP